jgi:hypothetical protein
METDICPEEDFDDNEQSIIQFMARQQDMKYRELTGQQMQEILSEFEDCEEWQLAYAFA